MERLSLHSSYPSKSSPVPLDNKLTEKQIDAFQLYSNDEIRMSKLKFGSKTSKRKVDETESSQDSSSPKKKKRISFELHQSMFYSQIIDQVYGADKSNGDGVDGGGFDILEHLKTLAGDK